uniref:Integrase catalytic domain-containing protein n=1 Tax=Nelumbo nucifera TaxID=4432 RepID=A0A822ZBD1_NELNU|nr:TPA_asm: hypothetical protein HUJ06_014669 [Nelumbo nucifera]
MANNKIPPIDDNKSHQTHWILDSGATDHITNSLSNFSTYAPVTNTHVVLPNNQKVSVSYIRTVIFSPNFVLHNVLYIPHFSFNLISTSKLTDSYPYCLIFQRNLCILQDHQRWKMIGLAKKVNGLYRLVLPSVSCNSSITCNYISIPFCNKPNATDIWHFRMGHLSNTRLKLLRELDHFISLPSSDYCSICHYAKQRKLSFPISQSTSANYFDLIHIDTWGPFSTPSFYGHKYLLTIVDDKSRYTWIYLMKTKSEARQHIQNFGFLIETQFSAKIKCIRSDNALEFNMPNFYASRGIVHQTTCVYTPQQNSIVERKHQHILNVARALRFQSQLSLSFWSDCICHAVYLINRTPSPIISNKTPFQLLYHTAPLFNHLKVFGCLCFASTLDTNRSKFDTRADPCVFLGYPSATKGFRLYNFRTKKVIISRDVHFHEYSFPFYSNPLLTDNSDFVPPTEYEVPLAEPSPPSFTSSPTNFPFLNPSPPLTTSDNTTIDSSPSTNISPDAIQSTHPKTQPRRSSRPHTLPSYLDQYHCQIPNLKSNSIFKASNPHPISSTYSTHKLSYSHRIFATKISQTKDPKTYNEAIKSQCWKDAMALEIKALEQNNTWVLTDLPTGKRLIGCKWIFKTKYHADGSIERYKARLVANGYTQQNGIDYLDTFSLVAKITTIRTLFAVAAIKNWHLHQLDINNAFLHGDLHEEVYMTPSPRF